jgi:hypothetical protein
VVDADAIALRDEVDKHGGNGSAVAHKLGRARPHRWLKRRGIDAALYRTGS